MFADKTLSHLLTFLRVSSKRERGGEKLETDRLVGEPVTYAQILADDISASRLTADLSLRRGP